MKSPKDDCVNLEDVMYSRGQEPVDDVIEGYALHIDVIKQAWARYRPSYQKNINMF